MTTTELQPFLIHAGLVTQDLIAGAVAATAGTPTTWLEHLVLARQVSDDAVAGCAARAAWMPRCDLDRLAAVPADVVAQVPWDLAIEHRMVPLWIEADGDLRVAVADPFDDDAVTEVEFFLGRHLLREVAPATALAWALTTYYRARSVLWPAAPRTLATAPRRSRPLRPIFAAAM